MSFVSNILVTWYYICNNELKWQFFFFGMDLTNIERIKLLVCITVFTEAASNLSGNLHLFCTNSGKVNFKKNGNVTVKNYLNESFLSLLCFIIYGQGSFEKDLMRTVRNLFNCLCFVTRIVCLVFMHAIEIGRVFLPLLANMLFVSITFSLEKVFVRFSAFVNLLCCVICELNRFAFVG